MEHPENRGTCTLLVQLLSRLVSKPFGMNFFLCIKPKDPSCRRYSSQRCSLNRLFVMRKYFVTIKSPGGTGVCVKVVIPWDTETRCSVCTFYAPRFWLSYQGTDVLTVHFHKCRKRESPSAMSPRSKITVGRRKFYLSSTPYIF